MSVAQIFALLQALDDRLTNPAGQAQAALHDILRIYGLTAQMAEVMTQQRDQIQALADAMAIYLGRMIEHDRRMIAQHTEMLALLQALARAVRSEDVAKAAEKARDVLAAEAAERQAAIELSAVQARRLLRLAQSDALELVKHAVEEEIQAIETATHEAIETIQATKEESGD